MTDKTDPLQRLTDVQQEIEAALAPEQKPVAWLSTDSIGERYLPTPPQKREWQGLTDDEISAISKSIPGETDLGAAKRLFAREIEAKLKEKNT